MANGKFVPTFVCLKRSDNNLTDDLSRFDSGHSLSHELCHLEVNDIMFKPEGDVAQVEMLNSLAEEEIPQHALPTSTHVIATDQHKDMQLFKLTQTNPAHFVKNVEGIESTHMEGKFMCLYVHASR